MEEREEKREADETNGKLSAPDAVKAARDYVEAMTGRLPETVSGINRADDGGWTVSLDVVELARVPTSTDVLATYEVTVDAHGDLDDLQRTRRYTRNQANQE